MDNPLLNTNLKEVEEHLYSKEFTRQDVIELYLEYRKLMEKLKKYNSHYPEGRNYTNQQYIELLLKYQNLLERNEQLRDKINSMVYNYSLPTPELCHEYESERSETLTWATE